MAKEISSYGNHVLWRAKFLPQLHAVCHVLIWIIIVVGMISAIFTETLHALVSTILAKIDRMSINMSFQACIQSVEARILRDVSVWVTARLKLACICIGIVISMNLEEYLYPYLYQNWCPKKSDFSV